MQQGQGGEKRARVRARLTAVSAEPAALVPPSAASTREGDRVLSRGSSPLQIPRGASKPDPLRPLCVVATGRRTEGFWWEEPS